MSRGYRQLLVLAALGGMFQGVAIAAERAEHAISGAYLAASCANCHGTTGTAQGAMPSLAGMDAVFLVEQMRLFRNGGRPATVMTQIAKGYSDAQVEAIADYFSSQSK